MQVQALRFEYRAIIQKLCSSKMQLSTEFNPIRMELQVTVQNHKYLNYKLIDLIHIDANYSIAC